MYAGRGVLLVQDFQDGRHHTGIKICARDDGPGIPDVRRALLDGYSTSGGLGMGLPGVKRLMDEFAIISEENVGTTVRAMKWSG